MLKDRNKLLQTVLHPLMILSVVALIVASYYYLDQNISSFAFKHDLRAKFSFLKPIILLGKWQVILLGLMAFALYGWYRQKDAAYMRNILFLSAALLLSCALCLVLKCLSGRARPDLLFSDGIYGFYYFKFTRAYWSFPSGHTTAIMAITIGLALLFRAYGFYLILLGLLIAFTRVIMYHHYLSDVLAGLYLTLITVCLTYTLFQKIDAHKRDKELR